MSKKRFSKIKNINKNQEVEEENHGRRDSFTKHDLRNLKPLTKNQKRVWEEWGDETNFMLSGSAGTGKTTCAIYLALNELFNPKSTKTKIIIVRSAVPSRDLGALPGDLDLKTNVYEEPYRQIFDDLFVRKNQYKRMKEVGKVEFSVTSYIRGVTFKDAIVIVDEAASMNYHELSTVITRLGPNCKIIICGDTKQNDLIYKKNDTSGLPRLLMVTKKMPSFRNVNFTSEDIVRSGLVKEFIMADESVT